MDKKFKQELISIHNHCPKCPPNSEVNKWFNNLLGLLYPSYSLIRLNNAEEVERAFKKSHDGLCHLLEYFKNFNRDTAEDISNQFIEDLPTIKRKIDNDLEAIFMGDPAAKSKEEVVRCYPGFYAIASYRIAHDIYSLGVDILPRLITEHAHRKTGIDIHPAASIGSYFCIDHGTGVVIGETSVIGNWVKIYQGVTLGALSVNKEDANVKRHPTIEDNVVIYANTTILGGQTIIGESSIIGGNVWITKSVKPSSTVYYVAGDNQIEKPRI